MRLTVVIPSRSRPFRLRDTIQTLRSLESGKHDIRYIIGVDSDDPDTLAIASIMRVSVPKVSYRCFTRLGSLGQMVNIMAAENPADCYVSLCDDVVALTPHWDEAIADAWEVRPDGLWWWRTLAVRPATYAIVSDKWYRAAGQIFTDYFPFWWDDMWLMQVWLMASNSTEHNAMQCIEAWLDDQAQNTIRMRDLLFWSDFYMAMKPRRVEQARRIAAKLGWPASRCEDDLCNVSASFLKNANTIEATQGDKLPPTIEYLKAKQRAERMMA